MVGAVKQNLEKTHRDAGRKSSAPDLALRLVRVGAGLIGLAVLFSMWASPDRLLSLPWFILAMIGVALVLAVTGRWLPLLARRVSSSTLLHFFLAASLVALLSALFTSNWPAYKISWLSRIYGALPTIRSLPFSLTQNGLAANQTGGLLAVLTAFAAVLATAPTPPTERGRRRPAAYRCITIILTVAGTVTVFMTGSRAALVGLVVAVLMVLVLRSRVWLWAWASGLTVALVGLTASGQLGPLFRALVRDETLSTKLVSRLDIWSSSLMGIGDHPFTGIGLGVFNEVIPVRYPYQTVGLSFPVAQAHNLFLDVALSIGIPGLLGLMLLLCGLVLLAVRGMKQDSLTRVFSLGTLASIAAFIIFGLTDSMSLSRPTSFILWLWPCALAISDARASQFPTEK
jgi:O-antigen ligase